MFIYEQQVSRRRIVHKIAIESFDSPFENRSVWIARFIVAWGVVLLVLLSQVAVSTFLLPAQAVSTLPERC